MKREIFFVRHGESHTNETNVHQAGDQVLGDSLNETGVSQARSLAQRFGAVAVDKIISSAYLRARETAQLINQVAKADIVVPVYEGQLVVDKDIHDPDLPNYRSLLREIDIPSELGGLAFKSAEALGIKQEAAQYLLDREARYSDQENYYDQWNRSSDIAQYLESRPEKTLVVVSHGGAIKNLIGYLAQRNRTELSLEQRIVAARGMNDLMWYDNTGVTAFTFEPNGEGWKWPVSDIDHLHPKYFSIMPEEKRLREEDSTAEA